MTISGNVTYSCTDVKKNAKICHCKHIFGKSQFYPQNCTMLFLRNIASRPGSFIYLDLRNNCKYGPAMNHLRNIDFTLARKYLAASWDSTYYTKVYLTSTMRLVNDFSSDFVNLDRSQKLILKSSQRHEGYFQKKMLMANIFVWSRARPRS